MTDYFSETDVCALKEIVEYPADSIGHADFIFSHGDYILLSEPKLNYLISSYNMATKSLTRFLSKGTGPNELPDVQQIDVYEKDTLFFVKSTFSKDIFIYAFNNTALLSLEQVPGDNVSLFFDGNSVICSQYGKKRFSLHDIQNKSTVEFGDSIVIENCRPDLIPYVLQGLCAGNAELKRFVWASIYGDIFEIYDYKNPNRIETINSTKGILPVIKSDQNQPVFSSDSKFGVVSITVTNKYIYMLYNENKIKDFQDKKDDVLLCNKILVYDWNGTPQKILKTNKLLKSISYNEKHKKIFCIGHDDDGNGKIFYIDDL
ncbi:MAG: TolB-like 6-bladed beta-propeller domain-containing protein [Tannerellaceae bacterium]|nr:TolB-like 6-bladed beta-propeller domain-containing protein [Tannerellaceae bacterium]